MAKIKVDFEQLPIAMSRDILLLFVALLFIYVLKIFERRVRLKRIP